MYFAVAPQWAIQLTDVNWFSSIASFTVMRPENTGVIRHEMNIKTSV